MGEKFQDTPHNVGQRMLDLLVGSLGGEWTRMEEAMIAEVEYRGEPVYLVKPMTNVNASGPILLRLADRLGFGVAECVLVYDDIDLSLGKVRVRMRGSSGGHRGVGSVLEAFKTDSFCRVKIGVGRPEQKDQVAGHVLKAFSPAELAAIEKACVEAKDRALKIVTSPKTPALV